MKQLLPGMETRATIDALLAFTKIEAGPKVDAIYFHFIQGCGQSRAAIIHGVSQSKLSEAITTLQGVASKAEHFHELRTFHPDSDETKDARIKAIMAEWNRGCSDTLNGEPSDCEECTNGAVSAIRKLTIGETV